MGYDSVFPLTMAAKLLYSGRRFGDFYFLGYGRLHARIPAAREVLKTE
jgi:hypothetical protein